MEDRPRRKVGKPARYLTTSFEEEPSKRKKVSKEITAGDIDKDIEDLREIFESSDSENATDMDENNFNSNTYTEEYINTQTHIYTHAQSQTNIPPHTSTVTHLTSYPHTSTNVPPHTSTVTHLTSYPHTSTNVPPHTSTVTHLYPHTSHAIDTSHSIHNIVPQSSMTNYHTHQFQENLKTWPTQENQMNEYRMDRAEILQSTREVDYIRITQEKLSNIDTELKRMNNLLQNVLRCVQNNNDRDRVPRKPVCLPISSVDEMDAFEAISDDDYREVINFFKYIGGFNLKEAVNLCLKERLQDSITPSFTWWGREKDQRPFYNT